MPGIGTFTLQHIPAQYNVVDKSLDPPGQRVTFEGTWNDDGSCLEWISLKENLVPAIASRKLEKYIEDLKASLQSGRPMELPGIGTLQADPQGQIRFSPEQLPGRPDALHLQPVLRDDAAPRETAGATEAVQNEVVKNETVNSEAADHYSAIPPWELEEQQSRFKWWWVAIPIAAALVATAIWWFVSNQVATESSAENAALTPQTATDTMSLQPEVTQTDTGVAAVTPAAIPDTTQVLEYFIVCGKYATSAAAEKRAKMLRTFGQDAYSYGNNDSTDFRVRIKFRSTIADTAKNIRFVKTNYGKGHNVYLEFNK